MLQQPWIQQKHPPHITTVRRTLGFFSSKRGFVAASSSYKTRAQVGTMLKRRVHVLMHLKMDCTTSLPRRDAPTPFFWLVKPPTGTHPTPSDRCLQTIMLLLVMLSMKTDFFKNQENVLMVLKSGPCPGNRSTSRKAPPTTPRVRNVWMGKEDRNLTRLGTNFLCGFGYPNECLWLLKVPHKTTSVFLKFLIRWWFSLWMHNYYKAHKICCTKKRNPFSCLRRA